MKFKLTIPAAFKFLLPLLVIFGTTFLKVNAQITYDNFLTKPYILQGSLLEVTDPDSSSSGPFQFITRNQYIMLKYTMDDLTDVGSYTPWSYSVVMKIMNGIDTTQYFTDTLSIQRNDSTPIYTAGQYYDLPWYSVSARVIEVCGKSGLDSTCTPTPHTYPLIPDDIELSLAIIHTEIKGLSPMVKNFEAGDYDSGEMEEDCEEVYNDRLEGLQQQYANTNVERLIEYLQALGANYTQLNNAEILIKNRFRSNADNIVNHLVDADMEYMFACDSVVLDSLQIVQLRAITSTKIKKDFVDDYLGWYRTYQYMGYGGQARAYQDPEEQLNDFFYNKIEERIEEVSDDILEFQSPTFIACYQASYTDPDENWTEYFEENISSFNDIRYTLLDSLGIDDSIYDVYLGAKLFYNIQTQGELNAKVNQLNSETYTLCGYSGLYLEDGCSAYYENLTNQVTIKIWALRDSIAEVVGSERGVNPEDLIVYPPSGFHEFWMDYLGPFYQAKLDSLDSLIVPCGSDSVETALLNALFPFYRNNEYVLIPAAAFLINRKYPVYNFYKQHNAYPDISQWQHITDSIIDVITDQQIDYQTEKRNFIFQTLPFLNGDPCFDSTYNIQKNIWNIIMPEMLNKLDSLLDADSLYAPSNSYEVDIAFADFQNRCDNDERLQDLFEEQSVLWDEKNEMCGTWDEPYQSKFNCLAACDNNLEALNLEMDSLLDELDSLTTSFRGISRPGGWNDNNADMVTMFNDYLIPEYSYRMDTLILDIISPCLDSTQLALFTDIFLPQNSQWEQDYYNTFFVPKYDSLIQIPIGTDVPNYISDSLYLIWDDFISLYGDYLGTRLDAKGLHCLTQINAIGQLPCIDSIMTSFPEPHPVGALIGEMLTSMVHEVDAGSVGITTDSTGYMESVMFYTFMKAAINNQYKNRAAEINEEREGCLGIDYDNPYDDGDEDPEPPLSLEIEIADCQSTIAAQVEEFFNTAFTNISNIPDIVFNFPGIKDDLNASENNMGDWSQMKMGIQDSIWISCNPDSLIMQIIEDVYQSDIGMVNILLSPPAYVMDISNLYEDGKPTYDHLDSFKSDDSLTFMHLAHMRAEWIIEKATDDPVTYGILDSCVLDRTDSIADIQYIIAFNQWQTAMDDFIDQLKLVYDSTIISPDSLELKIKWCRAEANRQIYNFVTNYVALEEQYAACEDIPNYKTIWIPEPDIDANEPKKLIIAQGSLFHSGQDILWGIHEDVMGLTTAEVEVVTESGECGDIKYLEWDPILGAEEYDLEWVYIDNAIYVNSTKANAMGDIAYRSFSLSEPTRVTVKENRFPFPSEYPDGKLYFRVRGVGRIIDNVNQDYTQAQYFPWIHNWSGYDVSSAPVNFNGTNPFNATFENNINWQWECSYAEEGKFKKVIGYHDGTNRPRQIVTHLSTDNLSVIGETLYDHEGRPAVQMIPYPEPCQELSYRDETRKDDSGTDVFDKEDFELDSEPHNLDNSIGVSQYYSVLNPFMSVENPLMHTGSIPDAEGYPYTRTTFMLDNTGRPTTSGGVGNAHRIEGGHETRYFYANASQTELHRLFGKNVGIASHYKKNAVIDANGQLSVAYVDQEGRTVATALAGLSPDNLLELESNIGVKFEQALTQNNVYDPVLHQWSVAFNQLNEVPDNEYEFEYHYGLDHLFPVGAPLPCIVCEFELEIYVTNANGERLEMTDIEDDGNAVTGPLTTFIKTINNDNSYQLADPCSTNSDLHPITFTVVMPDVGVYTIHKKLTWDKEGALEQLITATQPGNNTTTATQLDDLITEYISNIDYDQCYGMFPGIGFGNIPTDELDNTDYTAFTTQCQSYFNQMVDQIQPFSGSGPSPTNNNNGGGSPIQNSGLYHTDATNIFWPKVEELITEGIANPSNPAYIPPSAVAAYAGSTVPNTVTNIKNGHANWSEELKEQLVKAHPEYCWYTKCLTYAQSVPYDADMAQQSNIAGGQPYRNPQNMTPNGVTLIFPTSPTPPTAIYDPVNDAEINTKIGEQGPDDNQTIWQVADDVETNYVTNPDMTNSQATWQAFRGGYLQAKTDAFYVETGGCELLGTTTAIIKVPDIPQDEGEMSDENEENSAFFAADGPHCEDVCEQNANAWLAQMFTNCAEPFPSGGGISVNTNIAAIREYLIEYCMENCSQMNPLGIITEEMYDAAMASPTSNPLKSAMELYEAEIEGMEGCMTTQTASETFTYATDEYVEQCHDVAPRFNTTYSVLKFIGKLNNAIDNMVYPEDDFIASAFVSSGGSYIGVNTQFNAYKDCIPLSIDPNFCESETLSSPPINCLSPCNVEFWLEEGEDPIQPASVSQITITATPLNPIVFESGGDVIVPVLFDLRVANFGTNTFGSALTSQYGEVRIHLSECCQGEICSIFPNPWEVDINQETLVEGCEDELLAQAEQSAQNAFETWLDNYMNELWSGPTCEIEEIFTCSFTKREYHYTLYYYDQAANLVQTVPPAGVKPVDAVYFDEFANWDGTHNPLHDMESRYKFNSLQVAIESETPDGGLTIYKPDLMGRPTESINAQQQKRANDASATPGPDWHQYVRISSRTDYDGLGRIATVYEQKLVADLGYTPDYFPVPGEPVVNNVTISQITVTLYDNPISVPLGPGWIPKNTRARVAGIRYYETPLTAFKHGTYYSYDIHGNVKSIIHDVPALTDFGQRYKRMDYYYDLLSGKVNEVHYQPGEKDRFFHRYTYDADNRLTTAESSRDYISWERDAKYFYYLHGPLKRVETGHRKIQGSDYFYTIHGWLKGVNAGALNETYDVGRDGDIALSGNPNELIARDGYGFTLDYYNGDYNPIGTTDMNHIPAISGSDFESAVLENGLYNGNISRMSTSLLKIDQTRMDVLGKAYWYDQLNRIREDQSFITNDLHSTNSWASISNSTAYTGQYTYDANGNILTLARHNSSGTLTDNFTAYNYTSKATPGIFDNYNYVGPQNRLEHIDDAVTSLGMADQVTDNYEYDEIGNLVKDENEEIEEIRWTVYGKVRNVIRESGSTKPDLDFYYNASGQRYLKVVRPKDGSGDPLGPGAWTFTYYVHDAQGNVMAIYDMANKDAECGYEMYLSQHILYGSSRLGVSNYGNEVKLGTMGHAFPGYVGPGYSFMCLDEYQDNINDAIAGVVSTDGNTQNPGGNWETIKPFGPIKGPSITTPITGINLPWADASIKPQKEDYKLKPGKKQYEFSNHLGNVLVTISDMPIGMEEGTPDNSVDYYMPNILSTSDYEPFGAPLDARTESEKEYRFAFNGKEKVDEMYGEGNGYDFEARMYDARIGRWLVVDPLSKKYSSHSPYVYVFNNPICYIDPDGKEIKNPFEKYLKEQKTALASMEQNFIKAQVQFKQGEISEADFIKITNEYETQKSHVAEVQMFSDRADKAINDMKEWPFLFNTMNNLKDAYGQPVDIYIGADNQASSSYFSNGASTNVKADTDPHSPYYKRLPNTNMIVPINSMVSGAPDYLDINGLSGFYVILHPECEKSDPANELGDVFFRVFYWEKAFKESETPDFKRMQELGNRKLDLTPKEVKEYLTLYNKQESTQFSFRVQAAYELYIKFKGLKK